MQQGSFVHGVPGGPARAGLAGGLLVGSGRSPGCWRTAGLVHYPLAFLRYISYIAFLPRRLEVGNYVTQYIHHILTCT